MWIWLSTTSRCWPRAGPAVGSADDIVGSHRLAGEERFDVGPGPAGDVGEVAGHRPAYVRGDDDAVQREQAGARVGGFLGSDVQACTAQVAPVDGVAQGVLVD